MDICYDGPLPGQAFFAQFLVCFGPPVQFLPPFTAGRWTYLDLDWTPFPQDLLHGLQTLKSLQSQSAEMMLLHWLQSIIYKFWDKLSPVFWFSWKYFTWACLKFAGFRFGWISSTKLSSKSSQLFHRSGSGLYSLATCLGTSSPFSEFSPFTIN